MEISLQNNKTAFNGTTKIFAISDSHQDTRNTRALLSKILNISDNKNNILFLNGGDIFKGVYPKELERDTYVEVKELNPDIEMVMTLGNNDFGFNREGLDYLIETVKTFTKKGIKVVCANIFDAFGTRPEWLKPYTVITKDGDKTFVTGFCIDNLNTVKFGIVPKKQDSVLAEIMNAIKKEKPDNVVVLNHDYMPSSQNIYQKCAENGINIDVIIGGHDHEIVPPDLKRNIYYPKVFGESMYEMELVNSKGNKKVKGLKEYFSKDLEVDARILPALEKFEQLSKLLDDIVPSTLHLPKKYSEPSALGSFLADEIKKQGECDIGFFSTGFLMKPLEYEPNGFITNYKLKKAMIAENPIVKVELNAEQLKEVFLHAMKGNGYGVSNPKFLQCSNNIRLEGRNNPEKGIWELKQLYIDDEPLFDSTMKPLNPNKKYTCAIDSYIADGGQGFKTIQEIQKNAILISNKPLKINEALLNGLIEASKIYKSGAEYPHYNVKNV